MNIAYLIVTYRNPEQVLRLVKALEGSGDFYIHVDKKTNIEPYERLLNDIPSVHIYKNRISVEWAGWSLAKANLLLLQAAYNADKRYDRFVLLTGEDYPLMTNSQIVAEFEKNANVEYIMAYRIESTTIPAEKNKVLKKWYKDSIFKSKFLRRAYKSLMYHVITVPFTGKKMRVPLGGKDVDSYFGNTLAAFTRQGAGLLLNVFENDRRFNRRMKRVFAPDEIYWHTVIFNSELRKNTVQGGEEHEVTEHFGWAPLHYHNYDVYTSVYTEKDFDEVMGSGYMFCRKVVPGVSDALMDKIDEMRREK